MERSTVVLLSILSFALVGIVGAEEEPDLLNGELWKAQVLDELIPLWYDHVQDEEHGAFYMNLSRDWQPQPSWDKVPAMISRQVFSFSAAYLLSGEEKYLEVAREGAEYLLEHAWDQEYGGWFNSLTQSGTPKDTTKTVPLQLYTNVGLALYYFTSGDERVRSHIEKSLAIRQQHAYDPEYDGYFYALNRDLSVADDNKIKHAHYGYVGSLIHWYLATRDADFLQWEQRLMDLTATRMMDPELGWVYGYHVKLDRQWQPVLTEGEEAVMVGAQLTAALAFLRLYHQSGEVKYREYGESLGNQAIRKGWDAEGGGWFNYVQRKAPHLPVPKLQMQNWWVQIYGAFLQLQLYHITQDEQYLEQFQKMEEFFVRHFIDREHGGVFASVTPEGELLGDGRKAAVWHTSYHEIEHGLLNYLYLNLYVNRRPVVLHFRLNGGEGSIKHFVSLVDDPAVEISGVKIDGETWTEFDAQERSVRLPAGDGLRVEVELRPGDAAKR